MAFQPEYWLLVGIGDSRHDIASVRWRLVEADALAWNAAIGFAAKQATDAGELADAIAGLSAGTQISVSVETKYVDDAAAYPAADDNVYNFDQIAVSFRAASDNYTVHIPSRDDAAYNVAGDGVTLIITGGGATAATTDFVAAFNTAVEGKNGSPGIVQKMYVNR